MCYDYYSNHDSVGHGFESMGVRLCLLVITSTCQSVSWKASLEPPSKKLKQGTISDYFKRGIVLEMH